MKYKILRGLLIACIFVFISVPTFGTKVETIIEAPAEPAQVGERIELAGQDTLRELQRKFQIYGSNLAPYEPVYFTVGTDPEKSKFQLSFRYRFFNEEGPLAKQFPWVTWINLGYTQTSLWDLESDSKPFEDTSYKPELFILTPNIDIGFSWVPYFGFQVGYQHESNGGAGNISRSTNFIYVKPIFLIGQGEIYHLKLAPKVWIYANNDNETNPDIEDYRGYFDFEVKLGKRNGIGLGSHLGWAHKGGTVMLELTYPLHRLFGKNLDLYFYAQYFHGYAETLLDYNDKKDAVRLGIAIIR